MAAGWAYVSCSVTPPPGQGPVGAIQFVTASDGGLSGSHQLSWSFDDTSDGYGVNTLIMTGTLIVSGAISASKLVIETTTIIDTTGSTKFGNSTDDTHLFTGSIQQSGASSYFGALGDPLATPALFVSGGIQDTAIKGYVGVGTLAPDHELAVSGNISASSNISASTFWGSGVGITGILDASGTPEVEQVAVWTDADTLEGAANLTFDGSTLTVTGDVTASAGVVGASWASDGDISGSSTLQAVGATILGNTLVVSGAASFYGGVWTGLVSSSDSLQAVGPTTLGSTLNVSGTIFGLSTISGSEGHFRTLSSSADIALHTAGGNIIMTDTADEIIFNFNVDSPTLTIYDDADTGGSRDYCSITVGAAGATTIATNDDDGTSADLFLAADGDLTLDAAGSNITMKVSETTALDFVMNGAAVTTLTAPGEIGLSSTGGRNQVGVTGSLSASGKCYRTWVYTCSKCRSFSKFVLGGRVRPYKHSCPR